MFEGHDFKLTGNFKNFVAAKLAYLAELLKIVFDIF